MLQQEIENQYGKERSMSPVFAARKVDSRPEWHHGPQTDREFDPQLLQKLEAGSEGDANTLLAKMGDGMYRKLVMQMMAGPIPRF